MSKSKFALNFRENKKLKEDIEGFKELFRVMEFPEDKENQLNDNKTNDGRHNESVKEVLDKNLVIS